MGEPSPGGVVSALWRVTLAVLAAALVLNFAIGVLRCAWPWIAGSLVVAGVVVVLVRWLRSRRDEGW